MDALRRSAAAPALLLPQRAAAPLKPKKPARVKTPPRESGPPKHLVRYLPFVPAALVQETISFLNDPAKLRPLLQLIFSPAEKQEPIPERERAEYQQALEKYRTIRDVHAGFYRRQESTAAAAMWSAIEALPSDLYEEAVQAVTYAPPSPSENAGDAPASVLSAAAGGGAGGGQEGKRGDAEGPAAPAAGRAAAAAEDEPVKDLEGDTAETEETTKKRKESEFYSEAYAFPRSLMFHELYKEQILSSLSPFEQRKLQVYMNLMHLRYSHAELKRDQPALFWLPEKQVLSRQREGTRRGRRAQQ